nr:MAG: DNA pilot protein [Microvirus sp.]
MDPLVTSTLISSGADLLGGLLGKKKKGPSLQEQYDLAYKDKLRQLKYLPSQQVEGFKRAGIHPLYGLSGGSAAYSAPIVAGGDDGDNLGQTISEMGQGVARAAEAYAGKAERDLNRRLLEAQVKTAEASASGQELANVKLASEMQLVNQAGTPPPSPDKKFAGQVLNDTRAAAMKTVTLPSGQVVRLWDEDVGGDSEMGSAASFATYTVPDFLRETANMYLHDSINPYVHIRDAKNYFKRLWKGGK